MFQGIILDHLQMKVKGSGIRLVSYRKVLRIQLSNLPHLIS